VQQPLPKQIDEFAVTLAIDPEKDVDGFHPENLGKLVMGHLDKCFVSCTPYGILELLGRYGIETSGKHCVVVGRSNIVGKPMANLMLQKLKESNCTVTICHSATKDIASYTRQADILIAAIGRAKFITPDMVKKGAVVIDVGINRIDDATTKKRHPPCWRCRLRGRFSSGISNDTGSRRRRPHDHCHATKKHAPLV